MNAPSAPILCFGEILWDFLPDGLFLGGAPANVAYHLSRLGADARLLSSVGRDTLGDEALRRLRAWNLDTSLVSPAPLLPTGSVLASLGASGDAAYQISTPAAWDEIPADTASLRLAASARALVFGSLSQRSAANRLSLDQLLAGSPAPLAPDAEQRHARSLHARHACPLILVTAGPRGAGLLRDGQHWFWEPGRPVPVADTVGAGDGFLASFLFHLLSGNHSDADLLARACRHGEWIATCRGATPPYPQPPSPRPTLTPTDRAPA